MSVYGSNFLKPDKSFLKALSHKSGQSQLMQDVISQITRNAPSLKDSKHSPKKQKKYKIRRNHHAKHIESENRQSFKREDFGPYVSAERK